MSCFAQQACDLRRFVGSNGARDAQHDGFDFCLVRRLLAHSSAFVALVTNVFSAVMRWVR